jgi:hypothetical protein
MPFCRVCKQEIDKELDDWVMPSRNWYYHKVCYNNFKKEKEIKSDEDYIDLIFDYIARDLKVPYDYYKIKAQIKNFMKNGMTCKGMLFTLKYYYDRFGKENWDKGYGGIGIVPYFYKEATEYWTNIEIKRRGSCELLVQQIRNLKSASAEPIKYNPIQKKKKKEEINFDEILKEDELDS